LLLKSSKRFECSVINTKIIENKNILNIPGRNTYLVKLDLKLESHKILKWNVRLYHTGIWKTQPIEISCF